MDGEYIVGDNRARVSEQWSLFDSSSDRAETGSTVGESESSDTDKVRMSLVDFRSSGVHDKSISSSARN